MKKFSGMPVSKKYNLPDWMKMFLEDKKGREYKTDNDKMELAIKLSELNVVNKTGGPFGSAVFDINTGKLVAAGVNIVLPEKSSFAHGEIMAIMMSQKKINDFDLGINGRKTVLVSNADPCAMCYGALIWSGISEMICGARGEDVERLTGFDEGPLHPDWVNEAGKRGISIKRDILREKACEVLHLYMKEGGCIYNSSIVRTSIQRNI